MSTPTPSSETCPVCERAKWPETGLTEGEPQDKYCSSGMRGDGTFFDGSGECKALGYALTQAALAAAQAEVRDLTSRLRKEAEYRERAETGLRAEVERLTRERDEESASHENTVKQRDAAEEWADRLAGAIAGFFNVEIGDHSNANLPWAEALEAIPAKAQSASALAARVKVLEEALEASNEQVCEHVCREGPHVPACDDARAAVLPAPTPQERDESGNWEADQQAWNAYTRILRGETPPAPAPTGSTPTPRDEYGSICTACSAGRHDRCQADESVGAICICECQAACVACEVESASFDAHGRKHTCGAPTGSEGAAGWRALRGALGESHGSCMKHGPEACDVVIALAGITGLTVAQVADRLDGSPAPSRGEGTYTALLPGVGFVSPSPRGEGTPPDSVLSRSQSDARKEGVMVAQALTDLYGSHAPASPPQPPAGQPKEKP